MDIFKNIFYIIPVMFYYLLESAIVAIFVNVAWRFAIYPYINATINITMTYLQWVVIIWTVKITLFDVFRIARDETETTTENNEEKNN